MLAGEDIRRRALAAHVMRRLAGPAEAIAGIQDIVVEEIRPLSLPDALEDVELVQGAAHDLLGMLASIDAGNVDLADRARLRHDLRTPINAIIGYSELVLEDFADQLPEAVTADIRTVVGECALLLGQMDRVLGPDADAEDVSEADTQIAAELEKSLTSVKSEAPVERGHILVIDDTEANRSLMQRQLERRGHEVTTVGSAAEGLRALETTNFDLVLVDILMPDMNGIELLARMKQHEHWRHVPVIVISGLKEMRAVTRCIAAGAEDYLQKPVDPLLLLSRVEACLEKLRWHQRELRYIAEIEYERDRADSLLRAMLPGPIIDRLRNGESIIADRIEGATIIFADLVDFTPLTNRIDPSELVRHLSNIFLAFDDIAVRHRVEKIKTIGDAYMAASGVPEPSEDAAHRAYDFARDIAAFMQTEEAGGLSLRIGMHTGPVIAGLIGRMRSVYDVWGDTVNVASRLESTGQPGHIHVSQTTRDLLAGQRSFSTEERLSALKGLGEVRTFLLEDLS